MTQAYHFIIPASVEASSPLKVLIFNQRTLFTMSFIQLKQWVVFTMNDIELYWMWTLSNVNFTWILNDNWMDVKLFDWNLNKTVQRMNLHSVIILLAWNSNRELPWYPVPVTWRVPHQPFNCNLPLNASAFSSGSRGRVGGPRNMKSRRPPSSAIFFMTNFYRTGGAWPPRIRYWRYSMYRTTTGCTSYMQEVFIS